MDSIQNNKLSIVRSQEEKRSFEGWDELVWPVEPQNIQQGYDQINCSNVLQCVLPSQLGPFFAELVGKLNKDGELVISFPSMMHVCEAYFQGTLDVDDFHEAVFGPSYAHKCVPDVRMAKELLKRLGLQIQSVEIETDGYTVLKGVKVESN